MNQSSRDILGRRLRVLDLDVEVVVVGEDAGSKLEKARKIPGIRIISEKEFLELIGGNVNV